jgi:hypothetical protein
MNTRTAEKIGAFRRFVRAIGAAGVVALGGLLVGLGVLRATNVLLLIPGDSPQLWVRSGCVYADIAIRAALHATPDRPVFLVPIDQKSDLARDACRGTLAVLDHEGYRWLRYFPEHWLCQRLADEAAARIEEPMSLQFYADGAPICRGICDDVFERIGRPELQQFITLPKRGS